VGRGAAAILAAAAVTLACSCAPAWAAAPTLVPVGSFTQPMYVTAPPGDTQRVFVAERAGTIEVLDNGVEHRFLDITGLVSPLAGERGLESMAFAPDYATSGLFYVFYTAKDPLGQLTVAEYRRSASDADAADPASARIVLTIPHDQQSNHNGGQLQFGPDGMLYIGTGDGGSGGDPSGNGQDLTSRPPSVVGGVNHDPRLGKILRIDPRGGTPYAIPPGNPFPDPAREVFAYGLRNPWRFSFDRTTGDLAIGDVGQNAYEEIDFAPGPGANLGWNRYEGLHTYPGGAPVSSASGFTFPVLEKSHTGDGYCAIVGGYVVRDPALPELAGQYVYGDYCDSGLRAVTLTPGGASGDHALGLSVSSLVSFGEDGCGRVYAVPQANGPVYRLATSGDCAGPSVPFPGAGSGAGGGGGGGAPAPAPVSVSIGDAHRREGDHGTRRMTFLLTLSRPVSEPVSVGYATVRGTARSRDFTGVHGRFTIPAGAPHARLRVTIRGDRLPERNETFAVVLSQPSANAVIADGRAVGTIRDDDPALGRIRSRRSAPLGAGIRFTAHAFVAGRATWRFAAGKHLRLGTATRHVRRAGDTSVTLRLRRHAARLVAARLQRHRVTIHATVRYSARTGKRQTRTRAVRLTPR
jgi:glucose/arabinose dehydrogenase